VSKQFLAVGVAAVLGSALVAGTATAQPWSQQGTYDYYQPWSRTIPTNPPGEGYPEASLPSTSESFYPSTPVEREVIVNMQVPANARVTFNGTSTRQRGTNRHFVSPPIAAGRGYSYNVEATWTQNGRPVTLSRRIAVRPGDVVNLSFNNGGVNLSYGN
jgi:uncharacterized protein (TIGR03000 family)